MPDIPRTGIAFLLTQLGTLAAERFADSVAAVDLTPPLVGILRIVHDDPELSQLDLARRIGVAPSRVVAFVDELEGFGMVRRTRDPHDRRVNLLSLTATGAEVVQRLGRIARTHEAQVTAALTRAERDQLFALLTKLADSLELDEGIHPGYRHVR